MEKSTSMFVKIAMDTAASPDKKTWLKLFAYDWGEVLSKQWLSGYCEGARSYYRNEPMPKVEQYDDFHVGQYYGWLDAENA